MPLSHEVSVWYNSVIAFLTITIDAPKAIGAFRAMPDKAGIQYGYFSSSGTAHEGLTWRRDLNDSAPGFFGLMTIEGAAARRATRGVAQRSQIALGNLGGQRDQLMIQN